MSDLSKTNPNTEAGGTVYQLILFVAGEEPNSVLARQNLEAFCHTELEGGYELQVVNVFKHHQLALQHRVLVTPCLVMLTPSPAVMIAGTLQDREKVRTALRLNQE
ncbi:MAG: circadian clock KaiB family protein [Caldilineaceae bacterium]